jgi:hypothetical protein
MVLRTNFVLLLFLTLVALSGCYNTPVRHLAADVALLKVGESTEEDVLIFLGAPDEQQDVAANVQKWVYNEKKMTFLEKAPLVGKRLGAPEHLQVVVTIKNKIVSEVVYSSSDADDLKWADDFSWQEKKE